MEKFVTPGGVKSIQEVLDELLPKHKGEPALVLAAERLPHGVPGVDEVEVNLARYEVRSSTAVSAFNRDPVFVPTGPQGPTGPLPAPAGANGPAGPVVVTGTTGAWQASELPGAAVVRDRAEVDLRTAVRKCLREGVPLERIVEIFRLEMVDVVHED